MRLLIIFVFFALLSLRLEGAEALPFPVTDFGAVADDGLDDTAAFERAIAAASAHMSRVTVPRGKFHIERVLAVSGISVEGLPSGAWGSDAVVLPEIVFSGESGGILLGAGGAISGIQFTHNWQGASPNERPPTIELGGVGTRVSQVKIADAWVGIFADPKANVGRSTIESVFIVNVHHIGIGMAGTYDVTWIRDVEVWSPGSELFRQSGTGILLGKNDMLLMRDCFVLGAAVAYHFTDQYSGSGESVNGTWGTLSSCNSDFSGTGILVEGKHILTLSGGAHWCHGSALRIGPGLSEISVSGMELRANATPALDIEGGGGITVSGSRLSGAHPGFSVPAARVSGDSTVILTGSILSAFGEVLDTSEAAGELLIEDNVIRSSEPAGGDT